MISNVIPSVIDEKNLAAASIDLETASIFSFIEFDRRRNDLFKDSKYLSFIKYLWPVIIIQCGPENYLMIDNLDFFSLNFEIHKFEHVEELRRLNNEVLVEIKQINKYLNLIAEFIKSVYILKRKINGIMEPEIIKGISPLISLSSPDFSQYSSQLKRNKQQEDPSNLSNQYLKSLKTMNDDLKLISRILNILRNIKRELLEEKSNIAQGIIEKINKNIGMLNELFDDLKSNKEYLNRWTVPGSTSGIILPIMRIWFPLYVAEIKKINGEIGWIVAPPLIIQEKSNSNLKIDVFHPSFLTSLKNRVESNFNFFLQSIPKNQTINLFQNEQINRYINEGFERLSSKNIVNGKLLINIKKLWKENSS
jgi:hypothetical protein